jgi:hypothetical protein
MAERALGRGSWGAFVLALACSADLPAPGVDAESEADEIEVRAAAVPLRRLTREQYVHTIRDLFGGALPADLDVRALLPIDAYDGGFAANGTALGEASLEQYVRAAETIAGALRRSDLAPCLAAAIPTSECAAAFVDEIAPRVLRRTLDSDERNELVAAMWIDAPTSAVDADVAVRRVVATLLQSPDLLYRIERGEAEVAPGVVRLAGHEIAARMSYLLWASVPDAALVADAAAGRLRDPGHRGQVLERMLADPRARDGLAAMHRQWLGVESLQHLVKDRNVFPTFSEALGPELDDELAWFVDGVIRRGSGTLHSLLTSDVTAGSIAVETWYGADVREVRASAWLPDGTSELVLDSSRRAGVLTLLPVLASHAKPDRSDPVRRGRLVRERLLCRSLAAPPPDVPTPPTAPEPGESIREQLARHTEDPSCATCHALIDPLGFALEGYDAMGLVRIEDAAGNPIDTTATIVDSDIDGTIAGGVELAHALAASEQVERCYATQWFRYAVGRVDDADDAEILDTLATEFRDSGGHVPTLLRTLVMDDAFVHRRYR